VGSLDVPDGIGTGRPGHAEQLEQAERGGQPPGCRRSHGGQVGRLDGNLEPPGPVAVSAPEGEPPPGRSAAGRGRRQHDDLIALDRPAVDRLDEVADLHAGPGRRSARLDVDDHPLGEQRGEPEAPAAAGRQLDGLLRCEQEAVVVAQLGEHPADRVVGPGPGRRGAGSPPRLGPNRRPVDPTGVEGVLPDQVDGVGEVSLRQLAAHRDRRPGRRRRPRRRRRPGGPAGPGRPDRPRRSPAPGRWPATARTVGDVPRPVGQHHRRSARPHHGPARDAMPTSPPTLSSTPETAPGHHNRPKRSTQPGRRASPPPGVVVIHILGGVVQFGCAGG
jgi:hypothetical protein